MSPPEGPAPEAGNTTVPFVDPIIEDHEHTDLAAHNFSTPTLERLGYAHFGDDGASFTSFGEMDTHGTLAVVAAVLRGDPVRGAAILVDLTDPAAPKRLGYATIDDATHPLDVKFDEEGEFIYVSGANEIRIFDVTNPESPVLAGLSSPVGTACHMSALGVVGGQEYFWCTGDPIGLMAYRVVAEAPGKRTLVPVRYDRPLYQVAPVTDAGTNGVIGAPHDLTFQLDPVDGTPLLIVSNRGYGVRVLDVTNPATPQELGHWTGEGAEFPPLHMHTGMVTMIGGTRYLVVSPEILRDDETPPAIWVLDATDYAKLVLKAEWTAPGNHGSPGFTFTTHQWQVADERLYLGYYHAGVWVLDLPTILNGTYKTDPARPDVLGYYLPNEPSVVEGEMVPNVWDLNLKDGVMYVTDISSGFYVLHYLPDPIGDASLTGFS